MKKNKFNGELGKLKSIITENLGIKIIAGLISVVLWVFGVLSENPEVTRDFERQIKPNNLRRREYKVASDLPKARISVTANRRQLIATEDRRISASVNLEEIKEGISVIPVEVSLPPGMKFVSKRPENVTVNILRLFVKRMKVEERVEGPPFGLYLKSLEFTPMEVEIRAPRDEINQIKQAVAVLRLTDVQEGVIHSDLNVKLLTESGSTPRHAEVFPKQIRSRALVERWKPAEKTIMVDIKGQPAEGYRFRESTSEPASILVTASPETLKNIEFVETEAVNIDGITAGVKRTVKLKSLGSKVFPLNPDRVTVTVKVEKIPEPEPPPEEGQKTEEEKSDDDSSEIKNDPVINTENEGALQNTGTRKIQGNTKATAEVGIDSASSASGGNDE